MPLCVNFNPFTRRTVDINHASLFDSRVFFHTIRGAYIHLLWRSWSFEYTLNMFCRRIGTFICGQCEFFHILDHTVSTMRHQLEFYAPQNSQPRFQTQNVTERRQRTERRWCFEMTWCFVYKMHVILFSGNWTFVCAFNLESSVFNWRLCSILIFILCIGNDLYSVNIYKFTSEHCLRCEYTHTVYGRIFFHTFNLFVIFQITTFFHSMKSQPCLYPLAVFLRKNASFLTKLLRKNAFLLRNIKW